MWRFGGLAGKVYVGLMYIQLAVTWYYRTVVESLDDVRIQRKAIHAPTSSSPLILRRAVLQSSQIPVFRNPSWKSRGLAQNVRLIRREIVDASDSARCGLFVAATVYSQRAKGKEKEKREALMKMSIHDARMPPYYFINLPKPSSPRTAASASADDVFAMPVACHCIQSSIGLGRPTTTSTCTCSHLPARLSSAVASPGLKLSVSHLPSHEPSLTCLFPSSSQFVLALLRSKLCNSFPSPRVVTSTTKPSESHPSSIPFMSHSPRTEEKEIGKSNASSPAMSYVARHVCMHMQHA